MASATQKVLVRPLPLRIDVNMAVWVAQTLAAVSLARSGLLMFTMPVVELAAELGDWVTAMSPATIQLVGVLQIISAFALWAPSFVRIAPRVSAFCAAGLALVLLVTAVVHGLRGDLRPLVWNVTLAPIMAFIAWGRIFKAPIQAHAMLR